MSRRFWASLALFAIIVAVALAIARPGGPGEKRASAQVPSGITISLDMDTTDGPCTDIDASTSHAPGDDYDVAICVEGLYSGPAYGIGTLSFDVFYDDTLNTAPEVADSGQALDDNPDANLGTTTWGDGLGSGFDCTGGGVGYPKGDRDAASGPGHGDAFISCSSALGPWTLGDDETSGVLAVINFLAAGNEGTDSLTIANGLLGYSNATEMGTCNPAVAFELDCVGGTDIKTGTPMPMPTPTPTWTVTPLPGPPSPTPTWTVTPLPGPPSPTPTWTVTPLPGPPSPTPTPTPTPGTPTPTPLPVLSVSLDMDTTDGPCTDIDASASHGPGDSYYVAICVENLYEGYPIGLITFDVIYDDTLNTAPEVADVGQGLDDNPDLNENEYGDGLGSGWDCSNLGLAYPRGDRDLASGPDHGDAFISCDSILGPWTLGDDETSGVIARIHFVAAGNEGTDVLTIANGLLGYSNVTEMGTCNPAVMWGMVCNGGTDFKTGAPPVVATATATAFPTATSTPAGQGSISGVVTDSQGSPIEGAWVHAYPYVSHSGATSGSTYSGPDGSYAITGLAADEYRVWASAYGYFGEYYDDVYDYYDATPVAVVEGQDTPGIDFSLSVGGRISCLVADSDENPIEDARCCAALYPEGYSGGCCYTDSEGACTIGNLAAHSYVVRAEAEGYLTEYYDGAREYDNATPVDVAEEEEVAVGFSLDLGGTISGVVRDAQGDPLEDAWVWASPEGAIPISPPMPPAEGNGAWTGPDGAYTIIGLATGLYIVEAGAEAYVGEYYDGVRDHDDATPVEVTEGQDTPGIDFSLNLWGTISGVIRDSQGNPLPDAWACADPYDFDGYGECAGALWDGSYTITGLATGDYIVEAEADGYLDEYYDGVRDYDNATPVGVVEGQDTPDIDFSLLPSVPGDADGDGDVGMADAVLIAQCVVGLIDCDSIHQDAADVNCSGGVTMVDAMLVAQYVMGLIDEFPCS